MRIRSRSLLVAASLVTVSCAGGPPPPEPVPPPPPPFAALRKLDAPPPMAGDAVQGRAGDWLLQNERLAVVVAGPGPDRAPAAGNLIDAAPAGGRDALRGIFTGLGDSLLLPVRYDDVRADTAPDSSLQVLVASGRWPGSDSDRPRLRVETRYELRAGSDYLAVRTTVVNMGADTLAAFPLGDVVEWGRAEPYAPGRGTLTAAAPGAIPFAAASGEGSGYAWVSTAGDLAARHGRTWSDLVAASPDLAPGDTARYERLLFAVRGSAAPAQEAAWAMKGRPVGKLRADVEGDDGRPVADAVVEARDEEGVSRGLGETDTRGRVTLALPPGRYRVTARHPRRGPAEREREERVEVGKDARAEFKLPETATVTLVAVDVTGRPSPAKWLFTGIEGTPDPDLGPDRRADGAGRAVFSGTGGIRAEIPPGRYRVVAARGPSFEPWEAEATFHSGREAALQAVIAPLDLPRGWVAMDAGVQTAPSPGVEVAAPDRARALVSEGIEWFASIDRDRRTDYAPVIDALNLAAPLHGLPGLEKATPNGPASVYPVGGGETGPGLGCTLERMSRAAGSGDGGAAGILQLDLHGEARDGVSGRVEPSCPDSVQDPRRADAIELVGSTDRASFEADWKRWLSLLDPGNPLYAVGGAASNGLLGDAPWGARSFVFTGAGPATAGALMNAVRSGRVVVSDGPFIDFRLEGRTIGDTLVTAAGIVRGHLKVWAPSPVEVRQVTLIVDGEADSIFMLRGRDRSLRFDEDVEAAISGSGYVLVRVDGVFHSNPPAVEAPGSAEQRTLRKSIAFSNPIWVEIPGGGS